MKLKNIEVVEDFRAAVAQCKGEVWLESPEGDKYNLKSQFSQYLALGALLSDKGDDLELYCQDRNDERYFFNFFANHPEI